MNNQQRRAGGSKATFAYRDEDIVRIGYASANLDPSVFARFSKAANARDCWVLVEQVPFDKPVTQYLRNYLL